MDLVVSQKSQCQKYGQWVIETANIPGVRFFVISNLCNIICAIDHSGQEYGAQRGNGILPRAGALAVMVYAYYIPHSFSNGNNSNTPF